MSEGGTRDGDAAGEVEGSPAVVPARARLAAFARAEATADVTSFVAAALLFSFSSQGLFVHGWLVWPPLLAGAVCGLVSTGWWQAGLAAVAAVVVATLVQAPRLFGTLSPGDAAWWAYVGTMSATALGTALVVWSGRAFVAGRGGEWPKRYEAGIAVAMVAVLVSGMVMTAWTYQGLVQRSGMTDFQTLTTRPKLNVKMPDDEFYRNVLWLMRERSLPYYQAYRQAYHENAYWGSDPSFFLAYRLPTTFWFLNAIPGGGQGMVAAALAWTSVMVGSVALLARQRARWALVPVAAAAVAALGALECSEQFVLYAETWALPLLVTAVLLHEVGARSERRWRALTVAAVACAVGAALFREVTAFVFLAALLAGFFDKSERRRFVLAAWGIGLGVVLGALVAQYVVTLPIVSPVGPGWLFSPSIVNAVRSLRFSTEWLAYAAWVVPLIAVLGIAGAAIERDARSRAFMLCYLLLPLAVFMLVSDDAVGLHGEPLNYWGILLSPILYGLVPWTLARLPGGEDGIAVAGPHDEREE